MTDVLGFALAAHADDSTSRRADKLNAFLRQQLSKARVLRQEAVTRMHSLRAGRFADLDNLVRSQVRLRAGCWTQQVGFVG